MTTADRLMIATCAAIVLFLGGMAAGSTLDHDASPAPCPTGTHATWSADRQAMDRCETNQGE